MKERMRVRDDGAKQGPRNLRKFQPEWRGHTLPLQHQYQEYRTLITNISLLTTPSSLPNIYKDETLRPTLLHILRSCQEVSHNLSLAPAHLEEDPRQLWLALLEWTGRHSN